MTLIDVIVGVAIMLLVFLAIFGAFKLSIELVFSTKAKTGAVSLLTERMEYLRGLPYSEVGTVGGIPAGDIPQLEQVSLNGTTYTLRTLVQYTDAPEDGLDEDDENSVTADYKTVKVEALWSIKGSSRSTFAVTRIAPAGIETLEGGGTLRVNVFDALAAPVPEASVQIVNDSVSPAIDVSAETNTNGSVSFPGAPEASEYEITVTKPGYSSAQTYSVSGANPNPSPNHVSVVESQTTTMSFAIDELASLFVRTFEPAGPGAFEDSFDDASGISASSGAIVSGGALMLEEEALSGNAFSHTVSPSLLVSWDEFSFSANEPEGTSIVARLYYFDGAVYTLVPDEDVPENSTGLSEGTYDVSNLSVGDYGSLQLGAFLETNDASTTPALLDWSLSYIAGPTPLPNVDVTIRGEKTIGTETNGAPIYKFDESFTTTQYGEWLIDPVEWDAFTLRAPDFHIVEQCPIDLTISPGEEAEATFIVADGGSHSLRIAASSSGGPSAGATVTIDGPGVSEVLQTSDCGQAFVGDLAEATYAITISKPGYQTAMQNVPVEGQSVFSVTLVSE